MADDYTRHIVTAKGGSASTSTTQTQTEGAKQTVTAQVRPTRTTTVALPARTTTVADPGKTTTVAQPARVTTLAMPTRVTTEQQGAGGGTRLSTVETRQDTGFIISFSIPIRGGLNAGGAAPQDL